MEPTLKIEITEPKAGESHQVVKFDGEFDKAGHSQVRDVLDKCVKGFTLKTLIFDFSNLKFINSEGIGYLMEIHTHLTQRDRQLVLVGPNAHVKDVFNTIGIAEIIPIKTTVDAFLKK